MDPALENGGENEAKTEESELKKASKSKNSNQTSAKCKNKQTENININPNRLTRKQRLEQEAWIHDYRMLKQRYNAIERQLNTLFSERKSLWKEMKDIVDWKKLMDSQRNEKKDFLVSNIIETTALVCQFQQCFENIQTNSKYLESITKLANKIEDRLAKIKLHNSNICNELKNVETILYKELVCQSERFDSWNKDIDNNKSAISSAVNTEHSPTKQFKSFTSSDSFSNIRNHISFEQLSPSKQQSIAIKKQNSNSESLTCTTKMHKLSDSRPKELIEIENMLNEYGLYGGWPSQDHSDFLKLTTKLKNNDKKLLSQLIEILPHYSLTDIRKHLEWYTTYNRLINKKRDIIKQWKNEKNINNIKNYQNKKINQLKQIKLEKKKQIKLNKKRIEIKNEIKKWKIEKEEKNKLIKKIEIEKENKIKKHKKIQKINRIEKNKLLIQEIQTQNKLKQYSEYCQNIRKKPFSSRNEIEKKEILRKKFQIKDSQLLQQRMLLKEKKLLETKQRNKKLNNLIKKSTPKINIKRDPLRLSSMTSSVAQRYYQNNINNTDNNNKDNHVQNGPCIITYDSNASRAVPTWRRGL